MTLRDKRYSYPCPNGFQLSRVDQGVRPEDAGWVMRRCPLCGLEALWPDDLKCIGEHGQHRDRPRTMEVVDDG